MCLKGRHSVAAATSQAFDKVFSFDDFVGILVALYDELRLFLAVCLWYNWGKISL